MHGEHTHLLAGISRSNQLICNYNKIFGDVTGFLSGPANCISQALNAPSEVLWRFSAGMIMLSAILQMQLVRLWLIIGLVLSSRHGWETVKSKSSKKTLQLGVCCTKYAVWYLV